MKVFLGEVAEVFASSPYIHIGADEGSYGHLGKSPEEKAYIASHDVKGGPLGHYIRRVDRIVKGLGKRTICWEGFHGDGGGLPRDIIVMPFESTYNPPHKLNALGFPLICTPWKPLYVVNSRRWSPEYIYSSWNMWLWEHHTNARCHIQLKRESSNVLGAQMCAWEQKQEVDLRSVRGRLHAMAERTWAPDAALSYAHFAPRAERTDRLLDRMLALVRVDEQGLSGEVDRTYAKFPDTLTLRLSSPPIGTIRYTTDGTDPTARSRVCDALITLTHRDTRHEKLFYDRRKGRHVAEGFTVHLKARLFDEAGEPVGDLVTHKRYWFTGGDLAISASGLSGEKEGDVEKFVGAVEVTIAQPDAERTIRYTTDGTEPAATSRAYDGPFTLTHEDTRVQKILYDRRIGRHRKQGWVVTVRARRFDRANELINGLGVTRTYWYVGHAKKPPPPLVPPRKRK
jgi:hexosaminidase